MNASVFLDDDVFEALVGAFEALANRGRAEAVERWEIRLTLGGHGVLPASAIEAEGHATDLVTSLRSICRQRPARLEEAA